MQNENFQLGGLEKKQKKEQSQLENLDIQLHRSNFHLHHRHQPHHCPYHHHDILQDIHHHYNSDQEENALEKKRERAGKTGDG